MADELDNASAVAEGQSGEGSALLPNYKNNLADEPTPTAKDYAHAHGEEEEEEEKGNINQEEDEDVAALEMMMAFQENQEASEAIQNYIRLGDVGDGGVNEGDDDNLHPRIAFLGQYDDINANEDDNSNFDGNNNNDNFGGEGNGLAAAGEAGENDPLLHPNHNNPAAIALRQHQLRQQQHHLLHQNQNWNHHHPFLLRSLTSLLPTSLLRYTPLSLLAALGLLHHTLRTRQQFYLAFIYLQSSKLSYIILGNAIIALAVSIFSFTTTLFLDGGLRHNERDAISEHIRWDITETCLALTIFRSELDVVTAVTFLGLVVLKCLHWSVELRGSHLRMTEEVFVYPHDDDEEEDELDGFGTEDDFDGNNNEGNAGENGGETNDNVNNNNNAEQRKKKPWYQRVPRLRFSHIRFYTLLQILLLLDILAVAHCAVSVATDGPSVHILFGFESAILLVSALSAMGMYHLHVVDGIMGALCHWCEGEHHYCPVGGMAAPEEHDHNEHDHRENNHASNNTLARKLVNHLANPWRDRRATYSFVIELQAQAAKFLFYLVFFAIVFTYYGMPINIFREVYVSFQQLRARIIAFNNYRRLTYNMEKRFDDIQDEEELDRLGRTCIICRDQMDLLGGCKKLPGCGHAFHTHCLREWMVQQQTCPTCRADIAANEARRKREEAAAAAAVVEDDGDVVEGEGGGGECAEAAGGSEQVGDGAGAAQGDSSQTEGQDSQQSSQGQEAANSPASQRTPAIAIQNDAAPSPVAPKSRVLPASGSPKPAPAHFSPFTSPTHQPAPTASPHFPCLYRITSPQGAAVFPFNAVSNTMSPSSSLQVLQQRVIPNGKLVVCLAIEYWSMPFQQIMYRIPDGYVRGADVDRYLNLTMPDEGGEERVSGSLSSPTVRA